MRNAMESEHTTEEPLAREVEQLFENHAAVLEDENIRRQVRKLKQWLEAHRQGDISAGHLSDRGTAWMASLRDQLKLAADERQRLEGEGGPPATREQSRHTEEILGIVRRLDKLLERSEALPE